MGAVSVLGGISDAVISQYDVTDVQWVLLGNGTSPCSYLQQLAHLYCTPVCLCCWCVHNMCVCLASVCVRACAHVCMCVRVCVVSFNAASDEVLPTVNQTVVASSQVFSNGSMAVGSSETRHSAVLEMQTAGILYLRMYVHTYVRTYGIVVYHSTLGCSACYCHLEIDRGWRGWR